MRPPAAAAGFDRGSRGTVDPPRAEWTLADLERPIAARFEAQAARHGARLAVRGERQSLTYEELNRLANRIAHSVGVAAGGAAAGVALFLSHDALVPAAILGVLKAGRFYVPLEPGHPAERNAFMLEDSGADVLVTDGRNLAAARALAARAGRAVRLLNAEDPDAGGEPNPKATVSPHDLCFIVYTSGSTGRPKGVCQPHRNILHATAWYTCQAGLGPGDRMSLLHSLSAVAGATALYGALLNGAAILPFGVREAGLGKLADWLERERVTCLHAVPTLFRRLCRHLEPGRRLEDVRLVRLGGEAITRTEWLLWREHFPEHCRLLVGLGSTEALNFRQTVHDSQAELDDEVLAVGDPVPDKEVLLLDEEGNPVRPGETGEIVVRSEYLFAGYWRRPELNARALRPDPLDGRRRLFRTGDLGRFTPDGRLFHAGRVDTQIKIAGNRVEIAEVEQALRRLPAVHDAAVVPRGRGAGPVQLVAFAAVAGEEAPSRRELRASLREILPEHMIPALVVFVDELPLLPGGKVDRRALAERARARAVEHVGPRNQLEETLAGIWHRALGARGIGVHDDLFLDLGGDSLAAVEILAAIEELFQRQLPLSALYEAPTVAQLGARLLESGWGPPSSGLLAVNRAGRCPPLFGVCGVFGHALRLLLVGQALGPGQPLYGLQPPGMDWGRAGCETIESMAAHYLAEIRRIQPRGPYRLLGTSFGGVLVFEIAVQLQRAGEAVALLAMVDTAPPDCLGPAGIDRAERRDWAAGARGGDRLVDMGIRVARAHGAALDRYVARARFDGAITYFWCEEERAKKGPERRHLWGGRATAGVRIVRVPGRHGHFHREPQLSAIAAGLRQAIGA